MKLFKIRLRHPGSGGGVEPCEKLYFVGAATFDEALNVIRKTYTSSRVEACDCLGELRLSD